jgi:serine/threonine-protein kinase
LLLGNQFRKRANPEDWRRAVTAYERAIALDANFAAAHAGLALARGGLADSLGDAAGMDRALVDANKAIALAPDLADGYVARGTARLSFTRDWTGAQADLEKALELNPRDSAVQGTYGRIMIVRGRVAEAIAVSRTAIELDPLASDAWSQLGRMLNAAGNFLEARKALDRALEISPESNLSLFHRGMNSLLQGQAQEALEIFRRTGSGYGGAGVAMAEHSLGHALESQQALDQEIAHFSQGSAYQIAEAYAWRGEKDKAFEWLDRAYAQRDGGLSFIKGDPLLASVEGDPRYAALLEKMGLPK